MACLGLMLAALILTSGESAGADIPLDVIDYGIARTVLLRTLTRGGPETYRVVAECSGSFVSPSGIILTAAHCVRAHEDRSDISVRKGQLYTPEGLATVAVNLPGRTLPTTTFLARYLADAPQLDIAILRLDALLGSSTLTPLPADLRVPFVQVGDSTVVRPGESIVMIGFPSVGGDTVTVNRGFVTGFTVDDQGRKIAMKTDIGMSGNSGGPVLNVRGEQVAVAVSASLNVARVERSSRATLVEAIPEQWAQLFKTATAAATSAPRPTPAPPAAPSVPVAVLQGRVVDSDTGVGIAGAAMWVHGAANREEILATATTDGNGMFQSAPPIRRGTVYPIVVSAPRYRQVTGRVDVPTRGAGISLAGPAVEVIGAIAMQRQP